MADLIWPAHCRTSDDSSITTSRFQLAPGPRNRRTPQPRSRVALMRDPTLCLSPSFVITFLAFFSVFYLFLKGMGVKGGGGFYLMFSWHPSLTCAHLTVTLHICIHRLVEEFLFKIVCIPVCHQIRFVLCRHMTFHRVLCTCNHAHVLFSLRVCICLEFIPTDQGSNRFF